jgi:hypothetical protein
MKKKLILIRGLGHSGTTILDLFLGTHPSIIGIGEGIRTLKGQYDIGLPTRLRTDERTRIKCTCDETVPNCKIWGKTLEYVINNESQNINEKFSYISKQIYNEYGQDKIIVDSSQSDLENINLFNEKYDLKIIFLTRDLRSWVNSSINKYKHKSIWRNIWIWNRFNKNLEKFLVKNELDFFKFSYEEFTLETEYIVKKLSLWLDLNYEDWKFDLPHSNSHIADGDSWKFDLPQSKSHVVVGNRIRLDKIARSKITYDFKWIYNNKINLNYISFLPFLKRNNHFVFSNILERKKTTFKDEIQNQTIEKLVREKKKFSEICKAFLKKINRIKIINDFKEIYNNKINFNSIGFLPFLKRKKNISDDKIRIRTTEELESRRKHFLEISKILDDLNIFYFIQGGILLGARRDKKFIEWDWDVEISLHSDDFAKNFDNILKELTIKNFSIIKCDKYSNQKIDCYKEFSKETSTFTLLSWFHSKTLKKYYRANINIPENFLKNPGEILFYKKKFFTPSPIDDYLTYQYGDWRVRKRTSDKEEYMTKNFYKRLSLFNKFKNLLNKIF